MRLRGVILRFSVALPFLGLQEKIGAQMGTPTPLSPVERQKAEAERKAIGQAPNYPQLVDITKSTGISLDHKSSPEAKFIAESMSGGVALIDYDGDGWPDIYFTNAQSVEMAQHGIKACSALFHNNHDRTFTDVTDKTGVGYPCWAMGAVVGDFNNDGRDLTEVLWPDGKKETLTHLAADRYYVVREGLGIVSNSKPQRLVNLHSKLKREEIGRGPDSTH